MPNPLSISMQRVMTDLPAQMVNEYQRHYDQVAAEPKDLAAKRALWVCIRSLGLTATQATHAIALLASQHDPEALFELAELHAKHRTFFRLFEWPHVRRSVCLYANYLMMTLPLTGEEHQNPKHQQAMAYLNLIADQKGKYQSLAIYLRQIYKEMLKSQVNIFAEVFSFDKDLDALVLYFNSLQDVDHLNFKLYQAGKYDALNLVTKKYNLVDSDFILKMEATRGAWPQENPFFHVIKPVSRRASLDGVEVS